MKLALSMARHPAVAILAWAAATLSFTTPADAQAIPIPILNPSFDLDVLDGSPGASSGGLTGWTLGPNSGVFKASTTQYPDAPSTGVYCAFLDVGDRGACRLPFYRLRGISSGRKRGTGLQSQSHAIGRTDCRAHSR